MTREEYSAVTNTGVALQLESLARLLGEVADAGFKVSSTTAEDTSQHEQIIDALLRQQYRNYATLLQVAAERLMR